PLLLRPLHSFPTRRSSDLPMSWFFDQWVDGTAIPTYILSWHADPPQDGHYLLRVRVRQEGVPKNFVMPVPLKIEFADGGQAFVRDRKSTRLNSSHVAISYA